MRRWHLGEYLAQRLERATHARRRPLNLRMIRCLTVGLEIEIPTDVLIQVYRTVDHRAA